MAQAATMQPDGPQPLIPTFFESAAPVAYKRLDGRAKAPEFKTPGAAGFDLAVIESVTVRGGTTAMARTGLVIAAPVGHMLMLAPRSSTWKNWGLRLGNTVGIVDEDYCGEEDELLLALWNPDLASLPKTVPAGSRVAQGIFVPICRVGFEERLFMTRPARGGWGSTGA